MVVVEDDLTGVWPCKHLARFESIVFIRFDLWFAHELGREKSRRRNLQ